VSGAWSDWLASYRRSAWRSYGEPPYLPATSPTAIPMITFLKLAVVYVGGT
jgi:hypothetical protein